MPPALLLLAAACDDDSGKTTWDAEDAVRAQLRDPSSATFTDEVRHPPVGDQSAIICGKVSSRNGFGGMSGPRRFVSGGLTLIEPEGSDATAATVFDAAWDKFCSDPA